MTPCPKTTTLLALLAATLGAAQAQSDTRRSASIAAQRDARDNQSVLASASTALGEKAWIEAGLGRTRIKDPAAPERATVLKLAAGRSVGDWQAGIGVSSRRDGKRLRQTDWQASLERQWTPAFDTGIDLSWRDARQTGTVSSGGAPVAVEQRVKGPGLGLRAGANFGAARVYAGVTRYDYRSQTRQAGTPSGGVLGGLLGARPTGVTRESAALSRSAHAGASWRFERVDLGLEYLVDKPLEQPGSLRTLQLRAGVDLAPDWTLTPAVGRTRDAQNGGVNFGALSLSRRW